MESNKVQIQINAKGQGSKIQISQTQKKVEVKEIQQKKAQINQNTQLLMKLYVYGSCQSDQFRHPNKLSESKRPICLTNIQKFDLNDDEDDESEKEGNENQNIYVNPLFKKNVYKIACGGLHSVVLTTDGKAFTFGCNDQGALGRKGPECIPMEVALDTPVDLVSAGDNHTMFANSINGIVYFTGNYNYLRGQKMIENVNQPIKFTTVSLDIRNKNHPIQKLVSGANHTCILVNNKIFCRGEPQSFTTGRRINQRRKTQSSLAFDGVGLNNVQDVWCGGYHTVAKVKKGKDFVYHTWGKNDQGQLGVGNFKSQAYPVEIKSLRGKNIVKVAAGGFFTLFLTENGQILGCGSNEYGQLGLGQDYQFIPSETESDEQEQQEQKQQDLKKHVQQLNIDESTQKKQQPNKQLQVQNQSQQVQSKVMQVEPQNNPTEIKNTNQMVSEVQQKVIVTNSNQNGSLLPNINNIQEKVEQQSQKKKYQQKNTYIKSVRPLTFPEENAPSIPITNIAAGAEFAFAWNKSTELYSWGFGMNYVLLTGEENQEYEPFKVRNKIINNQIIQDIQGGGQHVLYTAYEKTQSQNEPKIVLDEKVTASITGQKGRLSRKRKN